MAVTKETLIRFSLSFVFFKTHVSVTLANWHLHVHVSGFEEKNHRRSLINT